MSSLFFPNFWPLNFFCALGIVFTYLTFEPWVLKKDKTVHAIFSASIPFGTGGAAILTILQTNWHLPTSFMDFTSEIAFTRANNAELSSHVLPFVLICMIPVLVYVHERNGFKALVYTGAIAFIGEFACLSVYSLAFFAKINWTLMSGALLGCAGMGFLCLTILMYKYKFSKWILVAFGIMALTYVPSLFNGAPITIMNRLVEFGTDVFAKGPEYSSLTQNLMDITFGTAGIFQFIMYGIIELKTTPKQSLKGLYQRDIRLIPL